MVLSVPRELFSYRVYGLARFYPISLSVWPLNPQADPWNLDAQPIGTGSF